MGVEVETLKPGTGKTFPQNGNDLKVHYTGTFASNGNQFDSSRDRGRPLSFVLGTQEVIKGWEEGFLKMSLGERAKLHISADFAYGDKGYGDCSIIGPNEDLIFDVELISINGKGRKELEKFEGELEKWVKKKLAEYDGDEKVKAKHTTKADYEQHLRKKMEKQLRHI
eukprot:gb/GFBE01061299.1/.p1 GENE.gb/GFBE01061299.1/~~gb/GFBE01061299.1/.p1  ORF type:complete len:168 (+),score=55.15 gb/GFBE01061299.1/:1-504(+)